MLGLFPRLSAVTQIKLSLLEHRAKECKDPTLVPVFGSEILFVLPLPFSTGSALRVSLTPIPVKVRGATGQNLALTYLCLLVRAGAAPAPPAAVGLHNLFCKQGQPQQVAAVAPDTRWGV